MNKFDVVETSQTKLAIVLSEELNIPIFDDACGSSEGSQIPLDITDPNEWGQTFKGYICYDLIGDTYIIASKTQMKKYDGSHMEGYIPYDHGTGRMRLVLGLIKLADKWYSNK